MMENIRGQGILSGGRLRGQAPLGGQHELRLSRPIRGLAETGRRRPGGPMLTVRHWRSSLVGLSLGPEGLCASQRACCGRGKGARTQVTEAGASHTAFIQRCGLAVVRSRAGPALQVEEESHSG